MSSLNQSSSSGALALESTLQDVLTEVQQINAGTPADLGQEIMANSQPVVIASDQSAIAVDGPLTDAELRASAVPVSGPLTDTQLRATAVPVSGPLTDTQLRATAVPVSASSLPLPTGASTLAEQQAQTTHLSEIEGAVETIETAIAQNGSAHGNPIMVVGGVGPSGNAHHWEVDSSGIGHVHDTQNGTLIGAVTETAPATDTASSGLNGRLQRIAQRITSLIALVPGSLGQKTMANSFAVTIASDQANIPVVQGVLANGTQVTDTVDAATADSRTAPANAVGFILQASDANSANLRWRIGSTATTTVGQQLQPGRDTGYIPCSGTLSIISESGTNEYQLQWIEE